MKTNKKVNYHETTDRCESETSKLIENIIHHDIGSDNISSPVAIKIPKVFFVITRFRKSHKNWYFCLK